MRHAWVIAALLAPTIASADPRLALTSADRRVDQEIGDSNGWVDDLELAVARAGYDVYRTTGMNLRPRLVYMSNYGGYETRDAWGPCIFIARSERPETVAFTVFHEAGHVAYRHDRHVDSQSNELHADEYAGRLVAATGADIRAAIVDIRRRGDSLHGTGDMRASALVIGYLRNGGKLPPDVVQRIKEAIASRVRRR